MILVVIDLWFVVKEDQDRITPYYLALTKKEKEKEKEDQKKKDEKRMKRASEKEMEE